MNQGSIAIIGAGVAGLAAGCYAQMNGYRTTIFEQSHRAGGLCASWRRGDYLFDGCIHWLLGTVPEDRFHRVWVELGVLPGLQLHRHQELLVVENSAGERLEVAADVDRFERHLLELSAGDTARTKELCETIRDLMRLQIPLLRPRELIGIHEWMHAGTAMLPLIRALKSPLASETWSGFCGNFRSSFLRETTPLIFPIEGFPLLGGAMILAAMSNGDGQVPLGGSAALSRALQRKYAELGGEIRFSTSVEQVVVTDDRAVGVRLRGGDELLADRVISAADGRTTLFEMLQGRDLGPEIRRRFEEEELFPPRVQISLGVDRDLSNEPHAIQLRLEEPLCGADQIIIRHFCHDGAMAPPGQSVVTASTPTTWPFWNELAKDEQRYLDEKRRIADAVVRILDDRIPGFGDDVEVVDVATPRTWERWTGNWRGSYEGWRLTRENLKQMVFGRGMRRTVPGLAGFYMIGHWVEPGGGLPAVAVSGREIVQVLCHRDGRKLRT